MESGWECTVSECFSSKSLRFQSKTYVVVGMGILLATVWVNLAQTSSKIVSNYYFCAFSFRRDSS